MSAPASAAAPPASTARNPPWAATSTGRVTACRRLPGAPLGSLGLLALGLLAAGLLGLGRLALGLLGFLALALGLGPLPLGLLLLGALRFGFLALAPGLGPPLFRFFALRLFGVGLAGRDLLGDRLRLLLAQRLGDRRQQLPLLVAHVLLERLAQLGQLGREVLALLGHRLELGQERADLLVVGQGVGRQGLGLRALAQRREQVLLLEPGQQLQLRLELREQPLAGLHGAVAGLGEPGEELVRLGGAAVDHLAEGHRCCPLFDAAAARAPVAST